ncbi:MAG TPA: EamA family transporter [Ilumatobacteraceae bacterium]|nr:EamA family transporter [Ilumatobacteraceae bacterium]
MSAARPIAAVVAAAVLFGTAGTAQELGPDGTTPLGVGAMRIAIGTIVLWCAVAWGGRAAGGAGRRVVLGRRHWPLAVVGGIGVATYTPLFLAAVDRTGVAVGTIVAIGSGPFFAGALEWGWRRVRPSRSWFGGTVVTVTAGVVLVAAQASDGSEIDVVGILFALTAGAGYALYSVTAKITMSAGVSSTVAIAVPFTIGTVIVAVLAAGEPFGWLGTPAGIAMALHLGVAATGVAYLLFGFGLRRLTSATTVTLVLAEPVTATLLAVTVLSESLAPFGWLGAAGVLSGLVVVARSAAVDDEPAPPPA